jgi:hypothetical protein
MPAHIIQDRGQIEQLRKTIAAATTNAAKAIAHLAGSTAPIEAFVRMKFHELGYHPIENRRLNLIEQVNQTFTYLVSLAAAEQILIRHPGSAPISLNLGTSAGSDLESASQSVAAEVFAAVRRTNNRKLVKDVAKVAETDATHKYVFFYCPGEDCKPLRLERFPDVEVIPLSEQQVWGDVPNV